MLRDAQHQIRKTAMHFYFSLVQSVGILTNTVHAILSPFFRFDSSKLNKFVKYCPSSSCAAQ